MIPMLLTLVTMSLLLSIFLVRWVRSISTRVGFLDRSASDEPARKAVPYGGGIAIFLAAVGPVVAGVLGVCWLRAYGIPAGLSGLLGDMAVHVSGALSTFGQLGVILGAALVIMLLGLADDRWRLPSGVKLLVEIAAALVVVLAGVRVTAFVGPGFLGAAVTVLWIVAITNAFNMLDNMDGLSAGVALIVTVILGVVAIQSNQFFIAALLAPLAGALAGFLFFNYPPASIYMGDAGSLFIGFLLAVIAVLLTFHEGSGSLLPVVLPLLVFSVAIYDMTSVIVIRVREGRWPWHRDRRHLSHRLVALGLSERMAVLAIHLLTLGIGLSATLLYLIRNPVAEVITIVQAVVILSVIVILEHTGRR